MPSRRSRLAYCINYTSSLCPRGRQPVCATLAAGLFIIVLLLHADITNLLMRPMDSEIDSSGSDSSVSFQYTQKTARRDKTFHAPSFTRQPTMAPTVSTFTQFNALIDTSEFPLSHVQLSDPTHLGLFPAAKDVRMDHDNASRVVLSLDEVVTVLVQDERAAASKDAAAACAASAGRRLLTRAKHWTESSSTTVDILYVRALRIYLMPLQPEDNGPGKAWISEEAYDLSVFKKDEPGSKADYVGKAIVEISAPSCAGILAALSSLSQLLAGIVSVRVPLWIHDYPQYAWRGLLIDVARHFIPLSDLLLVLDAMEASKLNVLHLHLTDSQSFPLLLLDDTNTGQPLSLLATNGSSRPFGKRRMYTLEDMRTLVAYAEERGIDVVPEIDMPAHSSSWAKAFPDILLPCPSFSKSKGSLFKKEDSSSVNPEYIYPLNFLSPKTMVIIKGVLKQVADVFPSLYFSVGGDEVEMKCLEEGLTGKSFMNKVNSAAKALSDFESEIFSFVRSLGKVPVVWQGVPDSHTLPSEIGVSSGRESVIQPWKCWGGLGLRSATAALRDSEDIYNMKKESSSTGGAILGSLFGGKPGRRLRNLADDQSQNSSASPTASPTKVGHPIVESTCWYLDFDWDIERYLRSDTIQSLLESNHAFKASPYFPSKTSTKTSVISVNDTSNQNVMTKAPNSKYREYTGKIFGGEASMWTEHVDFSNLHCRLWPRAGTIAAMLWGVPYSTSLGKVETPINISSTESISAQRSQKLNLYSSYALFRHYLISTFKISIAPIVLHEAMSVSIGGRGEINYIPKSFLSSVDFIKYLQIEWDEMFAADKLQSWSMKAARFLSSKLSCQCLGYPETLSRPLPDEQTGRGSDGHNLVISPQTDQFISIVQLNAADGASKDRRPKLISWLEDQARAGVNIVTFCEINGWDELESSNDVEKNRPLITKIASDGGFSYSYVANFSHVSRSVDPSLERFVHGDITAENRAHPYNIGLVASLPFEVIAVYGPPIFQRGLVLTYFPTFDLYVAILHLHAHSSERREREATVVLEIIKDLLTSNKKVVVTGDFNSLSPLDERWYDMEGLLAFYKRRDNPVFLRMRKKYCTRKEIVNNSSFFMLQDTTSMISELSINYNPISTLLSGGLLDSCYASCKVSRWSEPPSCPASRCQPTEPTMYDFEWPRLTDGAKQRSVRLDYILVSKAVVTAAAGSLFGGVQRTALTDTLSDHYPVHTSWKQKKS